MTDDDQIFQQIIDQNLRSMLYCVRSKETCSEIIRMFIKDQATFDEIKIHVLKIDRISKVQTKLDIFNELNSTLTNSQ